MKDVIQTLCIVIIALLFFSCAISGSDNLSPSADLVTIGSGIFKLGERWNCELRGFSIGRTEVTYELWCNVMKWGLANDFWMNRGNGVGELEGWPATKANRNKPVAGITWYDAIVWCNAYSEKDGLTPVYYLKNDSGVELVAKDSTLKRYEEGNGNHNILDYLVYRPENNGYRLPTEAEWECAAGGGFSNSRTIYPGTTDFSKIEDYGWLYKETDGNLTEVATKKPNCLGLYDMCGNATEWVYNWGTGATEGCTPVNGVYHNPSGPANRVLNNYNKTKAFCGASVMCGRTNDSNITHRPSELEKTCRCSVFYGSNPELKFSYVGFRIARTEY